MVYGELGRYKIANAVDLKMIEFWGRTVNSNDHKLAHIMYKFLRILHDKGMYSSPWIRKMHDLFNRIGMSFVWNDHIHNFLIEDQRCPIVNYPWLKKTVKLRLSDISKQEWSTEVHNNTQCKNYRIFKTDLKFEKYLTTLSFPNRLNLCKFRCSNSKIPSVTGGYQDILFDERFVPFVRSLC